MGFNAFEFEKGQLVRYSSIVDSPPASQPYKVVTCSCLAGQNVYWLDGVCGFVAEESLWPVQPDEKESGGG